MMSSIIRNRVNHFSCAFMLCTFLSSCGSGADNGILGVDLKVSEPIAVAIVNSAPVKACPNGGISIESGIDTNANHILNSSEVTSTQYVCNGVNGTNSTTNTNNFDTLILITDEIQGNNCLSGGSIVKVGMDLNKNNVLDSSEVTSFNFICNGTIGANGLSGKDGFNILSKTLSESAGVNCVSGGIKSLTGLDINANYVLDANEVVSTTYVCNGLTGSSGINGLNTLVSAITEPIGNHCQYGGTRTTTGLDINLNQMLEQTEVSSTSYVCNGFNGTNGTNGLTSISTQITESAGVNCLIGGIKLTTGVDSDVNGILSSSEVTSTTYVCNGSTGFSGTSGSNGTNGLNTLLNITTEPVGTNCTFGGSKTGAGLDTNGNNALDLSEVTVTSFICNGISGSKGADGFNSLIAIGLEPAGGSCVAGGSKAISGIDSNRNGLLESSEITSTTFVCNGVAGTSGAIGISGLNTLVIVIAEPAGAYCISGGSKTSTGLDTNVNGVLDSLEVTSSTYVCNGIDGATGNNGTNGVNGLSGLVGVVAEPIGNNCTYGGSRATSGLDVNKNLVLDAIEVISTTYVCNGGNGFNGINGSNGLNSLIALSPEPIGLNCLNGGSKASSGLDSNTNNTLDTQEITSTTYICTGATGVTGSSGGGLLAYAYIYNLTPQSVAIGGSVLFDGNGVLSGVTHVAGAAIFQVINAGAYNVAFSISATEPSQFGLFVNGVVVPGSVYGSGAGTQQNNGQITLVLQAGDNLKIVNYSSAAAVTLPSFIGGTQANINASVSIQKLN